MTNLEKLKALDTENFWKETVRLQKHQASMYIDYFAYLNSEDENILHFVRHESKCRLIPSEMEITVFCNTMKKQGKTVTEAEKEEYIKAHTKYGLLLEQIVFYDEPYAVILQEDGSLIKAPLKNVVPET